MSVYDIKASSAALALNLANPATHNVLRQAHYNVSPDLSLAFVPFSGSTSRLDVKFDTGSVGLGTKPYKITIPYRRIGNPMGIISVGIRKVSGDTFTLIAQHPVSEPNQGLITINVQGYNNYAMLANDKISIEYPPDDTNYIEVACGTGLPTGFTSQSYDGSYGATSDPLAIKITSKVLVAI